jgi:Ala-tRNA(Pro) deacylase
MTEALLGVIIGLIGWGKGGITSVDLSTLLEMKVVFKEGVPMPVKKLKEFLDSNKIKYVSITHSLAYTAQQIAATAHIPGKEVAKTVMVKLDDKMAMAVLPASYRVDFGLLRQASGASKVELATEQEFTGMFPECEVGAMPPFGNLYGMEVFVAESLAEDEEIAFNAGSHTELIRLAYKDFERLVKPKVVKFSSKN